MSEYCLKHDCYPVSDEIGCGDCKLEEIQSLKSQLVAANRKIDEIKLNSAIANKAIGLTCDQYETKLKSARVVIEGIINAEGDTERVYKEVEARQWLKDDDRLMPDSCSTH